MSVIKQKIPKAARKNLKMKKAREMRREKTTEQTKMLTKVDRENKTIFDPQN